MTNKVSNGIVPLVDWAATIILFPPDTSSILAVFHLTGLVLDLAAVAPGIYHCYTLLFVRRRRLYSTTSRRAGWRPMPRETLALCLTLFVLCDFCWHAVLLVGMGFPNTAHAFHNFRYCLVYAGLVQYLVGVMYSIPMASRRAMIQALGGAGSEANKDSLKPNATHVQNILDSSAAGAVISPVMSKRSWTRQWALAVLAVPVPSPYVLNTFLVTSILFPMVITLTLSFLVANAWTNETTLALQACLWATWASLAIAFGMNVFVFGNQLVLLVSQTIHSQTQRDRSRSLLKNTASSLSHSGSNLRGIMRPTSTSNATLEFSLRHQHRRSGMPARSASLSMTTDGHVVSPSSAGGQPPAQKGAAAATGMFPVPAPLARSTLPPSSWGGPSAITESATEGEHKDASLFPVTQSPTSSTQSDMDPTVPPVESTRVLGVAIDAHLDELADEPGEEIQSKSLAASGGTSSGGTRRSKGGGGGSSVPSSSSASGNVSVVGSGSTADMCSPRQSSAMLSDSGFGASANASGKPSSSKVTGKALYMSNGGSAVVDGSGTQLQPQQRTSPVGSANQLANSNLPTGKPQSVVTISTSQAGNESSSSNPSVNASTKPLTRSGQSGLLRGVTFAALLAVQARNLQGAEVLDPPPGDANLSASSTLSDAQLALTKRRLAQAKQLNHAKSHVQVSVACILLVSLAFAGISCFQVVGLLELLTRMDDAPQLHAGGARWVFWVPCVTHIMGGGAMAVPVLWSLAWESIKGGGKGQAGGLVTSPTL